MTSKDDGISKSDKGPPKCEYVFQDGQYTLIYAHTHGGYYCSYYYGDDRGESLTEKGTIVQQDPTPIHGDSGTHDHREEYCIYQFHQLDDLTYAYLAIQGDCRKDSKNHFFPTDLLEYFAVHKRNAMRHALDDVGRRALESGINLEIVIRKKPIDECKTERGGRHPARHGRL